MNAPMNRIPIAFVDNKVARVTRRIEITWANLSKGLSEVKYGKKDGYGWLPADIPLGPRKGDRVKSVTALVLDVEAKTEALLDEKGKPVLDHNGDAVKVVIGRDPPAFGEMAATLKRLGWRSIAHTSFGHRRAWFGGSVRLHLPGLPPPGKGCGIRADRPRVPSAS